jgi:hypothetical protein
MSLPQGFAYQIIVEEKVMFDSADPQTPVGNYLKVGDMTILLRDRLNGKGAQHEGGYVFLPTATVAGKTLTNVYTNTSAGSKYYVALDRGLVGYADGNTEFAW